MHTIEDIIVIIASYAFCTILIILMITIILAILACIAFGFLWLAVFLYSCLQSVWGSI